MIGTILCALVSLAFAALGIGSYVAPRTLAENYGLPVSDGTGIAYLRAVGTRDLALGLLVARFLRSPEARPALRATIAVSIVVAVGDLAVVASVRGREAKAPLAIHGSGALGLAAIGALLARER